MRIKVLPIVYNAVYAGVSRGLQISVEESKKPENQNNPELINEIISSVIMQNLTSVIDFGDELIELTQQAKQANQPVAMKE